jgi:dienelactone hydrolase
MPPTRSAETKSLAEVTNWPKQRKRYEDALRKLLGKLPKQRVDLQLKVMDEQDFPGYMRRRVNYFVDEWERITAWIFVPEDAEDAPALLCCHDAVPEGKDEPAGLAGNPAMAMAKHYAEMGYVTIAPDSITAGERVTPGKEPFDTAAFYKEHSKSSAFGRMFIDHQHAIDALCETSEVDPDRIGVVGHGLGGSNALLLAALDDRVRACAASCGFTRFADDPGVSRWTGGNNGFAALPQLQKSIEEGAFPLDWEHVLALAAPTPVLIVTALNDDQLDNTRSCETAVKMAQPVYYALAAGNAVQNVTHKKGHTFPREAASQVDEWFDRWL